MTESVSVQKTTSRRLSDRAILGLVLLAALLNGLAYTFLVPPWQHYDEPTHFEYVWLAANLNRLPQPGDYDPQMSRAVAISMVQNRFYGDTTSGMPAEGEEVHVAGYNQLDEPPGYYLLASLPLRLVRLFGVEDMAIQLRTARLASLLLYLLTIVCAWGAAGELARPGHVLRWMVPLSLALLPGFTDLMTAVNNDAGAVVVFSLFIWGSLRLIQRRFSWLNLAWVLAAAGLGYFTKVTALSSLALVPVVLLLAVFRGRLRWVAWAGVGAVALAGLLGGVAWGDAAWWARNTFQAADTRALVSAAPLGSHAFQLDLQPGSDGAADFKLHQLIALPDGESLKGQEVTVGAWMWADRPMQAKTPVFNTYNALTLDYRFADLTTAPQFVAFTTQVGGDAQRNFVSLAPLVEPLDAPATVYYDGVVVVPGSWPLDQAPEFADASGQRGTWGGQPFQNLLRNASAETAWLRLRPWVDRFGVRLLPDKGLNQPSVALYYFLDVPGGHTFQKYSLQVLFRTFWARFGWGHVPLMQLWTYSLILAAMVLGIIAAFAALWRLRRRFPWSAGLFLGLVLFEVWLLTFLRGANYPTNLWHIYYPTARYAYPAVIPLLMFLNLGWYELGRALNRWLHIPRVVLTWGYGLAWAGFNLYALLSIAHFYYGILG